MADPVNPFDFANETLAQFLAKSVGNGTYADVVEVLKVDQVGEEAAATEIRIAAGQIYGNTIDDYVLAAYPLLRSVDLGSGGLTLTDGAAKTTAYSPTPGEVVRYDASGGTLVVTLPASPEDGTRIGVAEVADDATAITVDAGANSIVGADGVSALTTSVAAVRAALSWEFSAADSTWQRMTSSISAAVASNLAATLAAGFNSGANDIEIDPAQSLKGVDSLATGVAADDLTIIAGRNLDGSGFGVGAGGTLRLHGATGLNDGTGGAIEILTGGGGTRGGNAVGGALTLRTGDGNAAAAAGTITIQPGTTVNLGGPSAEVLIQGSTHAGSSNSKGGQVRIQGGTAEEVGGTVLIKGGEKLVSFGSPQNSGEVILESGALDAAVGGFFGNITLRSLGPITPAASNQVAGDINLLAAASGNATTFDGGFITLTAGDTYGGNSRAGGSIELNCGDDFNGNSFSRGGSVNITPGTSVSGVDGQVFIKGTGSLGMLERAAVAGMTLSFPVAGYGRWWVRNDAPNTPMFTDDTNVDHVLNAANLPSADFTTGVAKIGAYSPAAFEFVRYDATAGTFTITLPASPDDDDIIGIVETGGDATDITVDAVGNTIIDDTFAAPASTILIGTARRAFTWQFDGVDSVWRLIA